MKVFFDTEFTGLHKSTGMLSIGLISESYDMFYATLPVPISASLCWYNESDRLWIAENVFPHLSGSYQMSKKDLVAVLRNWFEGFNESVEMWSDCLAYDWVLFCDLFGHAFNIPKCVYYIPFDICTLFKVKGIDPDINREEFVADILDLREAKKHDALWDAKVIKACYEKLMIIK